MIICQHQSNRHTFFLLVVVLVLDVLVESPIWLFLGLLEGWVSVVAGCSVQRTRVPRPGALTISKLAPTLAALSRMPNNP
jgi:hypothetical protein